MSFNPASATVAVTAASLAPASAPLAASRADDASSASEYVHAPTPLSSPQPAVPSEGQTSPPLSAVQQSNSSSDTRAANERQDTNRGVVLPKFNIHDALELGGDVGRTTYASQGEMVMRNEDQVLVDRTKFIKLVRLTARQRLPPPPLRWPTGSDSSLPAASRNNTPPQIMLANDFWDFQNASNSIDARVSRMNTPPEIMEATTTTEIWRHES